MNDDEGQIGGPGRGKFCFLHTELAVVFGAQFGIIGCIACPKVLGWAALNVVVGSGVKICGGGNNGSVEKRVMQI